MGSFFSSKVWRQVVNGRRTADGSSEWWCNIDKGEKAVMREKSLQEKVKNGETTDAEMQSCTLPWSKVIVHACHYVSAFLKGNQYICFIILKSIALFLFWWQFALLESK